VAGQFNAEPDDAVDQDETGFASVHAGCGDAGTIRRSVPLQ
jgi:hypothetical protein